MSDKNLWKWFSIYIRLRDADGRGYCTCFTCGRVKYWREMDCGHGVPRQHKATKYNEMNNHTQCKRCNAFEGGRMDAYAKEVDARYGIGTWDKLLFASKQVCKRGKAEIEMMTDYYRRQAQALSKQKGLPI